MFKKLNHSKSYDIYNTGPDDLITRKQYKFLTEVALYVNRCIF